MPPGRGGRGWSGGEVDSCKAANEEWGLLNEVLDLWGRLGAAHMELMVWINAVCTGRCPAMTAVCGSE